MKQIEFTLEAFGPDGMLKEGYEVRYKGCKVLFIKLFHHSNILSGIDETGDGFSVHSLVVNGGPLQLYRRTRTAEEVASGFKEWDEISFEFQQVIINAVQAGMDEMREP